MSHPYVVRIPLMLDYELDDDNLRSLERSIQRVLLASGELSAGEIQCVECFPACPCCDEPWEWCTCVLVPHPDGTTTCAEHNGEPN